jgi:hypothetical protein
MVRFLNQIFVGIFEYIEVYATIIDTREELWLQIQQFANGIN